MQGERGSPGFPVRAPFLKSRPKIPHTREAGRRVFSPQFKHVARLAHAPFIQARIHHAPHNISVPPLATAIRTAGVSSPAHRHKRLGQGEASPCHLCVVTFSAPTVRAVSVQAVSQAALVFTVASRVWKRAPAPGFNPRCLWHFPTPLGSLSSLGRQALFPAAASTLGFPLTPFFSRGGGSISHRIRVSPCPQPSGQTPLLQLHRISSS